MQQAPDEALFVTLDEESNSIAIIVKHLAGNMRSRWTDFLASPTAKSRIAIGIWNLKLPRPRVSN